MPVKEGNVDHLAWSNQNPTIPGLYWRRDSRKAASYLVLIYAGTQGLMMRLVDASHPWNDGKLTDRPLDWFSYGEWAGPLASRREEHIVPPDELREQSPLHTSGRTTGLHAKQGGRMEGNGHPKTTEIHATMIGCPACAGVLQKQSTHGHQQFVCTVGHAFTLETLYQAKEEELERAQWSATVLMEHLVMILRMFPTPDTSRIPGQQIEQRLQQLERHIAALRSTIEDTNLMQTEETP